ncbi:MAG TPA: rhomboid family intramembrane serine protease [Paludibacter sp.]
MNNYRPSFLNSIPPIVKNLIAINLILWLASLVSPSFFSRWGLNIDLTDILGMHYWASSKFSPAQLITYMFMHGGFSHILFNMFALYMFGGVLEQLWGPKRFLFYYLITGIGAGIVQQLFWTMEYHSLLVAMNNAISANSGEGLLPFQDVLGKYFSMSNLSSFDAPALVGMKRMFLDLPVTIGASGSVFGLLLAFGWLFPEAKLMIFPLPIPIKARIFVLIYGVAELFLGVAQFSGDSVAHFAHLGGMLFGTILILYWKKKNRL